MNVLDYAEITSLCQLMGMTKRPLYPVMPGESIPDTDYLWRLETEHGRMEVCTGKNQNIGAMTCQIATRMQFTNQGQRMQNEGYEDKEDAIKEIKATAHELRSGTVRERSDVDSSGAVAARLGQAGTSEG